MIYLLFINLSIIIYKLIIAIYIVMIYNKCYKTTLIFYIYSKLYELKINATYSLK